VSDTDLSELFARAVELDAEARSRLLAEVGAGDAVLASQLERLLSAAETVGGSVLDRSPWRHLHEEPPAETATPEAVGPYRVVRELGRGGMGRVFLAEQTGADFHRLVALKVVAPGGAGAEMERRFREERRILAGLEHPGIAHFYDAGRAADGTWFLALEYVQGENLLAFVRARGLDVRGRVELFLQVLDAVDFAHRRLVVHRDLKPGNVLVGADGRAKLLDFGISKILDVEGEGSDESPVTRTELRALTPAYASPEQLRGERVTIAADVYSLGVMLYEIFTGARPSAHAHVAAEPTAASVAARTRPPGEAGAAATVSWRELAGDLDAILLKALRPEPDSRYRSAAAFADDLRRWLAGQPVEARKGSRRYRLGKLVARHRLAIGAAAAVLVALAGGLSVAVVQRSRALAAQARAEATVADLHRLTQAMLFEIYEQVRPLPGSLVVSGTIVRRATEVLDRLAASAGDDPRMLRDLAAGYEQLGVLFGAHPALGPSLNHPNAAVEVLERAVSLRERIAALPEATFDDRLAAASGLGALSKAQLRARDAKAAAASAGAGIAALERLEPIAPDRAYLRYRLAAAHTRAQPRTVVPTSEEIAADPHLAAAVRLWLEFAHAPPPSALADERFTHEVGQATFLLLGAGHAQEALRISNLGLEALVRQPPTVGAEGPGGRRAALLIHRAAVLEVLGRPAEALADFREILRLRAGTTPDPDNLLAESIRNISEGQKAAELAAVAGDLDFALEALAGAMRSLAAAEERFGAGPFTAARVELERSRGDVILLQASRAGSAERARLRATALAVYRSALGLAEGLGNDTKHGVVPERVDELRRRVRQLETSGR
jgi:non-specific serine/threonine protein kinase/serine/threonine-protein kinase